VTAKTKKKDVEKLTTYQEQLQEVMKKIQGYTVGRTRIDPSQLLSPPKEYAARILYPEHLRRLFLHFLTGGEIMAQKDFILFMENVSFHPHSFLIISSLGDGGPTRTMVPDDP
jgi:hypothetical protein